MKFNNPCWNYKLYNALISHIRKYERIYMIQFDINYYELPDNKDAFGHISYLGLSIGPNSVANFGKEDKEKSYDEIEERILRNIGLMKVLKCKGVEELNGS